MGSLELTAVRRLAVVGIAKNCGKTTTLNALAAFATRNGRSVGFVSVGIDGEVEDVLLGTRKPPIPIAKGQWVVSATHVLEGSSAEFEYVDDLGIETPLGRVVLAHCVSAGEVVLAGLRHRGDLQKAAEMLEENGVDLVLIDGAYARVVAAHTDVADAVVVSTGAVISANIKEIVARTQSMLARLTLPGIKDPWQVELMQRAMDQDRALLGGASIEAIELPARSALVGLPAARDLWNAAVQALAVPGLVSDRVVDEIDRQGPGRYVLVPDGTSIQCSTHHLNRLLKRQKVRSRATARVMAVSINPTSIQGHTVAASEISRSLAVLWPNLPMFNPLDGIDSPLI